MEIRLKRLLMPALAGMVAIVIAGIGQLAAEDGSPVSSPAISDAGLSGAVAWLLTQQGDDGGFTGFSGESDPGITIDVIIALSAAGDAGIDGGDAIDRAVEYLESGDVALVYIQGGVGQAAKLVLGLVAVNLDPAEFAMVDALSIVLNGMDGETGIYGTGMFDHALAVLALTATGNDVPYAAIEAFAATQADNGGWAFDASTAPEGVDSNTTALGVLALVAAGQGDSDLVADGMRYLESVWTDGGAAYIHAPDTEPDANSTALAIQAFAVAGMDMADRHSPLAMFQNPSGAFHYNAADQSDNLFATVQSIPALALTQPSDSATPVSFFDALAA